MYVPLASFPYFRLSFTAFLARLSSSLLPSLTSSLTPPKGYNTIPSILQQITINLSLITAGIPSIHRFLSDLQTGQLGARLTEDRYELTVNGGTGNSNSRSRKQRSANPSAQNSRLSSKKQRSNLTMMTDDTEDEKPLKLTPETGARLSTRIFSPRMAGKGNADGNGEGRNSNGGQRSEGREGEEDIAEDSSTSSLKKNAVVQTREFYMEVEYEDGHQRTESRASLRGGKSQ